MATCVLNRRASFFAASLAALMLAGPAQAATPLNVVNVNAPAINCVFNPACTVTVSDTVGQIPLAGTPATGRLQTRTYVGAPGSPGAGKTAYVYRVNLTNVPRVRANPCVAAVTINFGYPVPQLQYNGAGPRDDVFVVTSGGIGSIGLASAMQTDTVIKFTFARPVCAGESSYFFGLAADDPPFMSVVDVHRTPGASKVQVPARRPDYYQ
jgi:hypothetical protein